MMLRRNRYLIFLWAFFLSTSIFATDKLPDIADIVQIEAQILDSKKIQLNWKIAPDYFIFQQKIRLYSETNGIELGSLVFPEAEIMHDSFFGDHPIYRQHLQLTAPISRKNTKTRLLKFSIQYQACLSFSQCYPQHNQTFELALHIADEVANSSSVLNSLLNNIEQPEYLNVEDAFKYQTEFDAESRRVYIHWQIADGYYLYQNKLNFKITQGQGKIKQVILPKALLKQDAYFGEVMIYPESFSVGLDIDSTDTDLNLQINYQGCADGVICYPPQTHEQAFSLPKKPDSPAITEASFLKSLDSLGQDQAFDTMTQGTDDFLEVDQAFQFSKVIDGADIKLKWDIADGYYLYKDKFSFEWISNKPQAETLAVDNMPKGEEKDDPYFGLIEIYHDSVEISLNLSNYADKNGVLEVNYQGCAEAGLCYPPENKKINFNINDGTISELNTADIEASISNNKTELNNNQMSRVADKQLLSEEQDIAKMLQDKNIFIVLALFFLMGLLLSLTPCIFPMIPILSSIIVGQNKGDMSSRQGFIISLVYVLSMAMTYSIAGIFAALLGENLQAALQNPWAIVSFVIIFVLLSLSMFGFYELQLPRAVQNKVTALSNNQKSGDLIGVSIMGFLSALIVGPCIAPPLAGALLYISQTGDWVLGGLSLFLMSIGIGVPLLIIGASAGKLLPKAGGWMDNVKYVFGVMLLLTGVWMLERVAPAWLTMSLYASLFIVSAVYLGALESLAANASGWRKLWKGLGVILLVYGTIIFVGMAAGGRNMFQPLPTPVMSSQGSIVSEEPLFTLIKGTDGLDEALTIANAQQKWLVLDFYADWCVTCKEWEHITFEDTAVQSALSQMVRVQADVTANDAVDKALLKKYKISGPPALLFFNPQTGQESRGFRLTGFKDVEFFLQHLKRLQK